MAQVILQINKRYSLTLTQIYAPTTSYSDEDTDDFYQQLADNVIQQNHKLHVIMGDFIAKVGEKSTRSELCIGPHGLGTRNERGQTLVDFAAQPI